MSNVGLLAGKKILVVDDEPDILEILEDILRMCKVVRASNFEDAKKMLETQDFDIAVLDIMGVDGYGLLNIANQRKIPAVMLTAHAFNPPNLVKSIKDGAASYIPKEEIARMPEFLSDVLEAGAKGMSPWGPWSEKLPSSYFEKRFGALWKASDKEFLEQFRAALKAKK